MNDSRQSQLDILHELPRGFLEATRADLHRVLVGPTLIHLPGKRAEPLFVSILLHGNEDVGLVAVQKLLRKYQKQILPRGLSIFVGNVTAARDGVRRLDDQPDYNRIWPGTELPPTPEHARSLGLPWRMTWYQFGWFEAYYQAGRYDDVLALADSTIKVTTDIEEMYYYKGLALKVKGDIDNARANFQLALQHNPNFGPAQVALTQ